MGDFPFDIMDIAALLRLQIKRRQSDSIYADCPLCGDKRGKMNLNLQKNLFRCNYCGEGGGMLRLYAKVHGLSNSEAYREICDTLSGVPTESRLSCGGHTGNRPLLCEVKAVQTASPVQNSELAGISEIHQTLSALLGMLTLSDPHRGNLRGRGLTDEQIDRLGYKSTPPFYKSQPYTQRLIDQGCTVKGVPGFYLGSNGKWTVKFTTNTAGILIPVRGIDGFIRGAQIRLDVPIKDSNDDSKEGTKYLWLSSSGKPMGVSSGSPVHFVGNPFARTVYVTEGSLKADIAHCLMNRSFAAIAGANNLSQLDPVFSALAAGGTELIVEAHDMDKYRNEMIDKGASKIYVMAHKYKMESRRLSWNPNHKGIDDWQLALKLKAKEDRRMNFKERFIAGLCDAGFIEDCIAAWHDYSGGQPLHEYLGLTQREYEVFLLSGDLEALLLAQRKTQRFRIYQLELTDGIIKPFAFAGIETLHKAGFSEPPASEYRLVLESEIFCGTEQSADIVLQQIYNRYANEPSKGFRGRCVSPSDLIELYSDEQSRFYYCNRESFTEVNFSPALAHSMTAQA